MAKILGFKPPGPIDDRLDIKLRLDEIEAEMMDKMAEDWCRDEARILELKLERAFLVSALAAREQ